MGDDRFRANLYQELLLALPDFQAFYAPILDDVSPTGPVSYDLHYGQATFIAKKVSVQQHDDTVIFGERHIKITTHNSGLHPRNLQHVELLINGQPLHIYNVHGLWTPDKLDNPDRLEQSARIIKQIESHPGDTILCGDFNLRPETESIKMLEKNLTNLITTNHISTTRSSLYTGNEPFADYTFVSPEIQVKSFDLPDVPVSDHRPMVMDFET